MICKFRITLDIEYDKKNKTKRRRVSGLLHETIVKPSHISGLVYDINQYIHAPLIL